MTYSSHFPLFPSFFQGEKTGRIMDAKSRQCVSCRTQNSTGHAFIHHQPRRVCFSGESWEICQQVGFSQAWLRDRLGSPNLATYERLSGLHIFQMVYVPRCRSNKLYCGSWVSSDWVQEQIGILGPLRLNKPVLQPSRPAACWRLRNRFVFQPCYFPAWLIPTSRITKQQANRDGSISRRHGNPFQIYVSC